MTYQVVDNKGGSFRINSQRLPEARAKAKAQGKTWIAVVLISVED